MTAPTFPVWDFTDDIPDRWALESAQSPAERRAAAIRAVRRNPGLVRHLAPMVPADPWEVTR